MTDLLDRGGGVVEPLPRPVVDTHCHLDIDRDDSGRAREWATVERALSAAADVGVRRVVQVGCDPAGVRWAVECATRYDAVVAAVAVHPNETPALAAGGQLSAALAEVDAAAAHPRVRAVGETGLDYYRTGPEGRATQQQSFREHIALTKRHGKALVIHDRDAHADVLRLLDEQGAPERTVFHCFSGDAEMARRCAAQGWFLSFAGTVTFRNAQSLRDALAVVPLSQLLVETDAPYLTPMPHRGQPNASALMPLTVRAMAAVTGVSVEVMCATLAANTERAFGAW